MGTLEHWYPISLRGSSIVTEFPLWLRAGYFLLLARLFRRDILRWAPQSRQYWTAFAASEYSFVNKRPVQRKFYIAPPAAWSIADLASTLVQTESGVLKWNRREPSLFLNQLLDQSTSTSGRQRVNICFRPALSSSSERSTTTHHVLWKISLLKNP